MNVEAAMDGLMKSCLHYFLDAIRSVSRPAKDTFEENGSHRGVSWELRQEILSGQPLIGWQQLPIERRDKIKEIVSAAERLPASALAGSGFDDLSDPAWEKIRKLALVILKEEWNFES